EAPSAVAIVLTTLASFEPVVVSAIAPVNALLPLVSAIECAPASTVVVPVTIAVPDWLTAPPERTFRLPPTVVVLSTVAAVLVRLTLLAPPLFDRLTAPVNVLPVWVSVMALFPAAKLLVPPTVKLPVWAIAPPEVTVRFRPIDEAAKVVARVLFTAA